MKPAAILIDLDGVVFLGGELIEGSRDAIQQLREAEIPIRFLTNTTTLSKRLLVEKLLSLGVEVRPEEIFTPASNASAWMDADERGRGYRLIGAPALVEDLGEGALAIDDPQRADWVVIGLHPPSLTHDNLSVALRDLRGGARLIALHVNRTWVRPHGLDIGLGAFVKALEYASEKGPTVIAGKPSPMFFEAARLSLPPTLHDDERIWMVGDTLDSDVGAAQSLGLRGALVMSGKTDAERLRRGDVRPDQVSKDLAAFVRFAINLG
ncbi:MAG: HAD-IIA family hydrolase [Myxococcota bacterium]